MLVNNAQASLLWDINYGIDLYKRNNLQAAKNYFLSYTSNNPNDKDAYFWLAKIYQKTKNEKNKAQECFKKAYELTLSEKNIEKLDFNINNNDNIEDYFDMAAMYFESGDFEEAELYADMMLKINPKSSSAYFIKAKVAHIMNKEQKAKEYLNLALIYNNDLLKTNLAKSLNISDIPDMSKEMYATFAYEAYFSGDIDKAIKYLKKCIALDSSNIDISIMLIDSFIKKNEIFEAQKMIDDILQNNPNDIQALYYQAKIYKLSNNEENYEQTCLKAYEINPNNQQILLELGNFYLAKEDYTNSKKYFEILVNVNDMFYEGYYGYIYSLIELGQLKEILPLVRKMTLINQNASINSFLLAKICEKQGDYEQAQEYLKEALSKALSFSCPFSRYI